MEKAYFSLLKQWCDALLSLQLHGTGRRELDGGIICPACHVIHGRCHDAVYPLMYLADRTGDEKYLRAAKALFDWGANLLADDGSLYNDAQSPWNGITVFSTNELCLALKYHGHLLTAEELAAWEARLRTMADWLHDTLVPEFGSVINYVTNCAGALALAGDYLDCDKYRRQARFMAHHSLEYFTENGLLMGEGKPRKSVTPRGCNAIDIGYNVEESMAALLRYALIQHDEEVKAAVIASMRAHLEFMLPDGGWDNSFGTRNFKWTYWGSRTSDGCQAAYTALGTEIPEFYEAARRNLELYERCSHGGLLHGGPHYHAHGENPCVHHSFCHAGVLAAALDRGLPEAERVAIPADNPPAAKYYRELDTWKLASGPFRATVTGYDFDYMQGGHASGGVMTLLWHPKTGPLLATGMTDYSMKEPTNQQQSLRKSTVACLAARVELAADGRRYSQMYDYGSDISVTERDGGVAVDVSATLADINHAPMSRRPACQLRYDITPQGATIVGWVSPAAKGAEFVLPVILADDEEYALTDENTATLRRAGAEVRVEHSGLAAEPRRIFNFSGGFSALELRIAPDADGNFAAAISVN